VVSVVKRGGPGLVKTKKSPLLTARTALLVRLADGRWKELLASADSISEGGARQEAAGRVWYGTTSLVVLLPDRTEDERAFFAAVASNDPHLRVRATRIAHREAASRAPAILGRAVCELTMVVDPRGLRIDVDVQAPLIEGSGKLRRTPSP
jgi:hypothetical protein